MKENLFLVEMLMLGSSVAGKQKNVPSSISYESTGYVNNTGKANMGTLRGYESACEGNYVVKLN